MKGLEQDPESGVHVFIFRGGGVGSVAVGVGTVFSCLGVAGGVGCLHVKYM